MKIKQMDSETMLTTLRENKGVEIFGISKYAKTKSLRRASSIPIRNIDDFVYLTFEEEVADEK